MKKLLPLLFALCLTLKYSAQDFHLSQYDMLPLYFNPALTGMFVGNEDMKYRFCGNYRSQWQKIQGKPYSSVGVGYDMPFNRFGAGIIIGDHIAGVSNFSTFNFLLSGAYRITSNESRNHTLTAGLQLGFFQKRFSYNDLLFENQYTTTDGLNPNLPNGETLPDVSIVRFDANLGMFYKHISKNGRFDPSLGLSVYHLTQPNESFTGQKSRLPMRFNGMVACEVHFGETFTITPNALFMYQKKAMELNAGAMMRYKISDSDYSILIGGGYRLKDALIFHIGMRQGNNIFRISYDMVTSPLKGYGGSRGGLEMGVIYSGWTRTGRRS